MKIVTLAVLGVFAGLQGSSDRQVDTDPFERLVSSPIEFEDNSLSVYRLFGAFKSQINIPIVVVPSMRATKLNGAAILEYNEEYTHAFSLLDHLLAETDLQWTLANDMIVISAKQIPPVEVQVFDLKDESLNREELVAEIEAFIETEQDEKFHPSCLKFVGDKLAIAQTSSMHCRIAIKFEDKIGAVSMPQLDELEDRFVRSSIFSSVQVEFFEDPIEDALMLLRVRDGFSGSLDIDEVEVIGVDGTTAVNASLNDTSIYSVLRLMCWQHDMALKVDEHMIVYLTTHESAEENLVTADYDLSDLEGVKVRELRDSIIHLIQYESWSETLEETEVVDMTTLRISQTFECQIQIHQFLERLKN